MPYFSRLKLGRAAGIAIALLAATGLVVGCGSSGSGKHRREHVVGEW